MTDYQERTRRVLEVMAEDDLDALLVTKPDACGYILGSSSTGQVLVTREGNYLFSYFVELAEARDEAQNCTVIPCDREQGALPQIAELAKKHGVRSLGFEAHALSHSSFVSLHEAMPEVQQVPSDNLMDRVRNIKTASEIAGFRRACAIDDAAFSHLLPFIGQGVRELDLVAELEYFMRKEGVTSFSFPSIAVSGPRSSYCHGAPSTRKLEVGDFVTFDYGAVWDGCPSDITRTVVVGEPTARQEEVYDTVLEAQKRAFDVLKPGVAGEDVDAAARQYIGEKGYGDYFGHGLGHALGGGTHVGPRVKAQLQPGCIVTIEPGIYIEGWGGVRIEDDVLITEHGYDILTRAPKELIRVG